MESWEGYNYYTTNSSKWILLMNLSTSEWGVSPLPPFLVALNGSLADQPPDVEYNSSTLVIEHAGQAETGDRATEKIIFGITSAIAISFWLVWLWMNRKTLLDPLGSAAVRPHSSAGLLQPSNANLGPAGLESGSLGGSTVMIELGDLGRTGGVGRWADMLPAGAGLSAGRFDFLMRGYYYQPFVTEVELVRRSGEGGGVDVDDIERLTELVRKMLFTDQKLWNNARNNGFTEEDRRGYMHRADDALAEVGMEVRAWGDGGVRGGWGRVEREKAGEIKKLVEEIRRKRQPS